MKPTMTKKQNKKREPSGRQYIYWWLAAIVILTAIVYFRATQNDFTFWDDPSQVSENTDIRALTFENIKTMFSKYYVNMYQPLTTLSFAIEYHFAGLNPTVYHTTNVILHLFNLVLVFFLVSRLAKNTTVGLVAACLFGIHPMHVESVAWITERKDVLYAFFYLGALIFYLRYINGKQQKYYWSTLAFFLLSLFTKSAAVTFALVVVLVDWYENRKFDKRLILEKIPFFILALIFGIISIYSQTGLDSGNIIGGKYSIPQRPFLAAYALVFYVSKLFIPINLSALHIYRVDQSMFLPIQYLLAPIPLALLLFVLWKIKPIKKEIIFGFGLFVSTIILNLHIIPVGGVIAGERYAYIPYIGLYLLLGHGILYIKNRNTLNIQRYKELQFLIGVAIILSLSYITYARIGVWHDTVTLFENARDVDGVSRIGNQILSAGYSYRAEPMIADENYPQAIRDLTVAIECDSTFHRAWYNRGIAKQRSGDFSGALSDFDKAIDINSKIAVYYNDRGNARIANSDTAGAMSDYMKAITINPELGEAYANRARIYYLTGKQEECCRDLRKADSLGYKEAARLLEEHCK
jgi:protein O-mannosyl-transferase